MYKLSRIATEVMRLTDGALIPQGHRYWDEYQKWLAAGNTPQPVDPPTAPIDFSDPATNKSLMALALVMRNWTNQLKAGTYTDKSLADLKAAFKTAYEALP